MVQNLDNLLSYYNTLLTIEVAVIGIIVAAIFVFVQLVYSRFSYKEVRQILLDPSLIAFLILSAAVLGFTSLASLSLALGSHDFFPRFNFNTRAWITDPHILLSLSILLLATALLFLLLIARNLKFLHPGNLLAFSSRTWKKDYVKKYLFNKYGIPEPYPAISILFSLDESEYEGALAEVEEELRMKMTGEKSEVKQKSDARIKFEKEQREKEEQHEKDLLSYEQLQKKVKNTQNPFSDANQIALEAIGRLDLRTYYRFLAELESFFSSLFDQLDEQSQQSISWNPNKDLPEHAVRLLIDLFLSHLEMIDQFGLHSARIEILRTTDRLAKVLVKNTNHNALARLASFWKRMADKYMVGQPQLYTQIVNSFRDIIVSITEVDGDGESANEMYRDLGWLGEKLFLKEAVLEEEPLMPDDMEQSSLLDDLMNAVLKVGDIYTDKHPQWYPLIYFDAVDVIFLRIVEAVSKGTIKIKNSEQSIFNLLWVYSSFAEEALMVGNSSGAALSAMRLKASVEELHKVSLEKRRNEAIDLLLWLAAFAAGHHDKFESTDLLSGKTFEDWVIDAIMPYMDSYDISSEVLEIYIKGKGDRAGVKDFIVKLADSTGLNFRLNIEAMRNSH